MAIDFMLELGWHKDKVDTKEWIKNYVKYRYGKNNEAILAAWQGFLETIYSSPEVYQEGGAESIFCARPSVNVQSISSWGTRKRNYDVAKFAAAVKLFVSASKEFEQSETYQVDKIDLVRQVNANKGDVVYQNMIDALNKKDVVAFEAISKQFQKMIVQQNDLLNCNPHFSLHTWLKQAADFGTTPADKELALRNAKEQITIWGPYDPQTNLHDYAFKEWGGLLGSLYLDRWKMFEKEQIQTLRSQSAGPSNYFETERKWTAENDLFVPHLITKEDENSLISTILH
ncbi:MAG TPA: alpha-N-acetylglucosaminidase C-terminal domain-containing protein [Flavobacterium sp.]|nr:alpha-N-acetylglucosaminidase C-terminal domain-containing protein [Flavobacterium sp.]